MRVVGFVLVILSLGLAGGVATHAVGGSGADAKVAGGERCEVGASESARRVDAARMQIRLTPAEAGVEVVPLNTRGYNYADPTAAPTPARAAAPTPPASPEH